VGSWPAVGVKVIKCKIVRVFYNFEKRQGDNCPRIEMFRIRLFFGHTEIFSNGRKKLSQFDHNVRKYRLVSIVGANFNIMGQMTEMSRKKEPWVENMPLQVTASSSNDVMPKDVEVMLDCIFRGFATHPRDQPQSTRFGRVELVFSWIALVRPRTESNENWSAQFSFLNETFSLFSNVF